MCIVCKRTDINADAIIGVLFTFCRHRQHRWRPSIAFFFNIDIVFVTPSPSPVAVLWFSLSIQLALFSSSPPATCLSVVSKTHLFIPACYLFTFFLSFLLSFLLYFLLSFFLSFFLYFLLSFLLSFFPSFFLSVHLSFFPSIFLSFFLSFLPNSLCYSYHYFLCYFNSHWFPPFSLRYFIQIFSYSLFLFCFPTALLNAILSFLLSVSFPSSFCCTFILSLIFLSYFPYISLLFNPASF
ncbi:unnamed protein product [Acanthosepion pharaonis]|uniref:Uncharacterized protein n=1 Tax=Acanthosepion pharaonis TaxID=158019 RepID=A0A812E2F1_ACAPH|nr:unnamed protein product [Sepia pharaonis]